MPARSRRNICFVTGTRAEFGLMRSAFTAIQSHPQLNLQLIATGMHLDAAHGAPLAALQSAGFKPSAVIPWPPSSGRATPLDTAIHTGSAISHLARAFARLKSDIILITGDRVEAFAAATAAHLSGRIVAHVHGGDRAQGQVDDSLRHAITKLAHIHFPATLESAQRIRKLGEDPARIHRVGSPGLDGIRAAATPRAQLLKQFPHLKNIRYAILLLHPTDPDPALEQRRAELALRALRASRQCDHLVIIHPNNDPGSGGILAAWKRLAKSKDITLLPDLPRSTFLALLRDAVLLAGNSSSGIIEAASFSTPVLDIGPRQSGRQRSQNVLHSDWNPASLRATLQRLLRTRRGKVTNVYGGHSAAGAGARIARILASLDLASLNQPKLIRY